MVTERTLTLSKWIVGPLIAQMIFLHQDINFIDQFNIDTY